MANPNSCSSGYFSAGILGDTGGRTVCVMAEPAKKRATYEEQREESVEEILAAARPLPLLEEMMIEDLSEEEARAFYEAIDNL
jgi:hypothetical protein